MTRPTKAQVHHAMTHSEGWSFMGSETVMPGTGWEKFEVLAAEVEALREEYALACRLLKTASVCAIENQMREPTELETKLARAEALSAKWRDDVYRARTDSECADELEAALGACASSEPDTAPISTPDGQAEEPVVLENPAKQRETLP